MICWISQNQNLHKYNFSLINLYLNSLLNNYDKFNIFWKSLNCNFWTSYDFFQNFSLFSPNSTFNFLSIELFKIFLRFFFEFIWIIQNKAFLITENSLLFCVNKFGLITRETGNHTGSKHFEIRLLGVFFLYTLIFLQSESTGFVDNYSENVLALKYF